MLKLIMKLLKTSTETLHNLNTSHVKVNLIKNKQNSTNCKDLNTSHVKVNLNM